MKKFQKNCYQSFIHLRHKIFGTEVRRWRILVAVTIVSFGGAAALLSSAQAAIPAAGLVGHWSFNEGSGAATNDSSGNALHGTLVNGPAWAPAEQCVVGSCLLFDGSNDHVRISDSSLLKINSDITISAWIKPTALGTAMSPVSKRTEFQLGPTQTAAPYGLNWSQRQTNGATISGSLTSSTDAGIWQHVVLVRNGATKTITGYKNSALQLNSTYAQTPNTSSYNLTIGRRASGGEYFKGLIDEVRIYNRVLSAAEIADLYAEGGTQPPSDTEAPSIPTGLTATAASSSQIGLSWSASTDNVGVTGYRVYRNGSQVATATSTSYQDSGLAASTTYNYTVAAYDAANNLSAQSSPASATTLAGPPQRQDVTVASGFANPTSMAISPDGRLFVAEQGGNLRVIKNDTLLPAPFLTVSVTSTNERGLLGVTFDPNFSSNGYIYIYYTTTTSPIVNRVSRFTVSSTNPDVADPSSETFILNNIPSETGWHNGGAIHFGGDGRLYVAVGEGHFEDNAQRLDTLSGKFLRINADGSIPTDNPFYDGVGPNKDEIWALGLRNPFTFDIQPVTGRIFINNVGENAWEEINEAWVGPNNGSNAGFNFGWPACEGPQGTGLGDCNNPAWVYPFYAYPQSGGDCAITGGSFYNPTVVNFPAEYVGDYFFADYCSGWIKNIDLTTKAVSTFIEPDGARDPVDIKVANDGSLYYLARANNFTPSLHRVNYTGTDQAPSIVSHPQSITVSVGDSATFTVSASGTQPLAYQWQRDGVDIPGATGASYTLSNAQASDSGAQFRAIVTNSLGNATSNAATLTVTTNTAPTGSIIDPAAGSLYSGGDTIAYSGTATDAEDGTLPASAFTWRVDFHHESHTHPFIPDTSGSTSGSFTVPTAGETSSDVWYRIYLTVRDSGGLTHTSFRDIQPRKANITLTTNVAGLQLNLDGQPVATPHTVTGVVGVNRTLNAPSPQTISGTTYEFVSWSDGGAQSHSISTPGTDTTYTATYQPVAGPPPLPTQGLVGFWAFDEGSGTSTTDGSGNNNPGIFQYGATWGGAMDCKIGTCVLLDGVDDYVRILDSPTLQITGDITISAWIKPTQLGNKLRSLVSKRYEFELGPIQTASPYQINWFQKEPGGTAITGPLVPSSSLNAWQHVVLVRNGITKTITGYLNNEVGSTSTYANTPGSSTYNPNIGRHAAGGQHFKGLIDEVRIYNRILSSSEIGQLYNQSTPAASSGMTIQSLSID